METGYVARNELAEVNRGYSRIVRRKTLFIVGAVVLLITLCVVGTAVGEASLSLGDVSRAILSRLPGVDLDPSARADSIVWNLRLPRVLMAGVAGMGLAASGMAMQAVLRNPLVSPFTTGVSSAAGFGAALAIVLGVGLTGTGKYLVISNAFVFAVGAVAVILAIARVRGTAAETMVLSGIAIMYLFAALTSFMQYVADQAELHMVVHWLFGSLTTATWEKLAAVSVMCFVCFPMLMKYAWDLNAMAAGDESALSLGVRTGRVRVVVMGLAALIAAGIICFTGIIGFVCLVSPHITRMIIGGDHRYLLPCSALVGALLLLSADTLGRTIIGPSEIPVGIMTAFIGVPFFLYLLLRNRRQQWQ